MPKIITDQPNNVGVGGLVSYSAMCLTPEEPSPNRVEQALPFEAGRTYAEKAVLFELHREKKKGETIHARKLATRLGMNERLVRQCISNLVEFGEPILSSTAKGYWLARTQEEFDKCIASLMRRAAKIFKRAWRLKKGAPYDEMAGLLRLALEEKENKNATRKTRRTVSDAHAERRASDREGGKGLLQVGG